MDQKPPVYNAKTEQLDKHRKENTGKPLTNDSGAKMSNDEQSLGSAERLVDTGV